MGHIECRENIADMVNGACAANLQLVADDNSELGSPYRKPVSSIMAKELRDAADTFCRHARGDQLRRSQNIRRPKS
jgi:hypothetical protein